MESNDGNKGVIIAVIIGVVVVGIAIGLIVFNVLKPEEPSAPSINGNPSNPGNNSGQTNNGGSTNNGGNNGGSTNNEQTEKPSDGGGNSTSDPNSISNLTNLYPNATSKELEKIKEIREQYNNASDTIIVEKLLDKKDTESACIFLENGNPNISTILKDDYNKYYIGLVGTNCLSASQTNKIESASKERDKEILAEIKENIGSMAIETCYEKIDDLSYEFYDTITLRFTEVNIGEIVELPLINPVTNKEVDLYKSTVVYDDYCELKSVNVVDK